jgi:hypothetical protein
MAPQLAIVVHQQTTLRAAVLTPAHIPVRPSSLPISWATAWRGYPQAVIRFATCVAHHESWSAGLWTAQNGRSTASGFGQWLNGTWQVNSVRAGVPVTARARYALPRHQVAVFAWMFAHHGQSAWNGTHCGYGT